MRIGGIEKGMQVEGRVGRGDRKYKQNEVEKEVKKRRWGRLRRIEDRENEKNRFDGGEKNEQRKKVIGANEEVQSYIDKFCPMG